MEIKVMGKVLEANDAWAQENRALLKEKKIVMMNIIGSPGAGKTTLLERTIKELGEKIKIGVIEGDIATTRDAERIQKAGAPVCQINTGTACHLDANLVHDAIKELISDAELELIIVENIGNLVCPAEFDIGEDAKIGVLSVSEGDDKIEKYPLLFSESKALVISKMNFLNQTNFDLEYASNKFREFNQDAPLFKVDSLSGDGFYEWIDFVLNFVKGE